MVLRPSVAIQPLQAASAPPLEGERRGPSSERTVGAALYHRGSVSRFYQSNLWTAFTDYNLDMNKIGQIRLAARAIKSLAAGCKIETRDKRLLISLCDKIRRRLNERILGWVCETCLPNGL